MTPEEREHAEAAGRARAMMHTCRMLSLQNPDLLTPAPLLLALDKQNMLFLGFYLNGRPWTRSYLSMN